MEAAENRYQTFTGLILSLSRSIQRIKNAEMARYGLKGKQVQCLFSLYSKPEGASMSDLADLCGEDRAALYRTIQELTARGLVYTDEASAKKYKKLIKLTEKGHQMAEIVTSRIAEIVDIAGTSLKSSDRAILYDSLSSIAHTLDQICQDYEK